MTTTIDDRLVPYTDTESGVYSRPAARFDADGNLEVRASAAGNCRRALWYAATGCEPTNPPSAESLTVMEAGNALEGVVLRAMERTGWEVTPADPQDPQAVSVRVGHNLLVTGHPDATGTMPLFGDRPSLIEVKTRGPEAFKRWAALGAERSHPASVAQAAFYTLGLFGEMRDAVIATMDTGSRAWDHEVIPAERVGRALQNACERLGELGAHHVLNGPDPDALPERDFKAGSWQCNSCPFLNACLPGMAEAEGEAEPAKDAEPEEPVTDEEAQTALRDYEELQDTIREFEDEKRWVAGKLRAWLKRKDTDRARLQGREKARTIGMVTTRRYSVDYRKLNALLDPQTRAEIVTEKVSEYLRVS